MKDINWSKFKEVDRWFYHSSVIYRNEFLNNIGIEDVNKLSDDDKIKLIKVDHANIDYIDNPSEEVQIEAVKLFEKTIIIFINI
jgi:hypothetical protein